MLVCIPCVGVNRVPYTRALTIHMRVVPRDRNFPTMQQYDSLASQGQLVVIRFLAILGWFLTARLYKIQLSSGLTAKFHWNRTCCAY